MENENQPIADNIIQLNPFGLKDIIVPIFAFNDIAINPSQIEDKLQVVAQLSIDLSDEQSVIFTISIEYYIETEESKKIQLLKTRIDYEFIIQGLEEIVSKNETGKLILPMDYIEVLSGIVYSTSRGIIFSKTQGTVLNKFILPLKSPLDLIAPIVGLRDKQ